jgi:hypothetical protein
MKISDEELQQLYKTEDIQGLFENSKRVVVTSFLNDHVMEIAANNYFELRFVNNSGFIFLKNSTPWAMTSQRRD